MAPPHGPGSGAGAAHPSDFKHGTVSAKLSAIGESAHAAAYSVIVDMDRFTAFVAHQEDAVVLITGMAVGQIRVRAFHPHRKAVRHKQIKNAVDRIRRNALAARGRKVISNIIGRNRPVMPRQFGEHGFAHRSPLLTIAGQSRARSGGQIITRKVAVRVNGCRFHLRSIGAARPEFQSACAPQAPSRRNSSR